MRKVGLTVLMATVLGGIPYADAQEASVKQGINDTFKKPDPKQFLERFEKEGREVFDKREQIVAALHLQPGWTVADVGAGTGLFTRLIASKIGAGGKVYAVDIADSFVKHAVQSTREAGYKWVEGIVCAPDDARLPENAIDLAFICDTYHHFEFPFKTMASIFRSLKKGGQVVVVDFKREEGVSSDWILKHVRAGKDVVIREIQQCGFVLEEQPDLLKENYLLRFRKAEAK
jgi:ubiquinone/menaquinone biosynthesis C-methylase UbiE